MSCLRFYFGKLCRAVDNFFAQKVARSEEMQLPTNAVCCRDKLFWFAYLSNKVASYMQKQNMIHDFCIFLQQAKRSVFLFKIKKEKLTIIVLKMLLSQKQTLDVLPPATFVPKCDKNENIRRFFVILFAYIEKKKYFCTRLGIKCIVCCKNIPFEVQQCFK